VVPDLLAQRFHLFFEVSVWGNHRADYKSWTIKRGWRKPALSS